MSKPSWDPQSDLMVLKTLGREFERVLGANRCESRTRGRSLHRLSLTDPPTGTPVLGSSFCDPNVEGGFGAGSLPVRDTSGQTQLILFGPAPGGVAAVQLVADKSQRIAAQTFEGPGDRTGDLWVVAVSPGVERAEIEWLGKDGEALGPRRDVSGSLRRLNLISR